MQQNDVIQSYAQTMPTPDPKIESLLVQNGLSDVAKLCIAMVA